MSANPEPEDSTERYTCDGCFQEFGPTDVGMVEHSGGYGIYCMHCAEERTTPRADTPDVSGERIGPVSAWSAWIEGFRRELRRMLNI